MKVCSSGRLLVVCPLVSEICSCSCISFCDGDINHNGMYLLHVMLAP